MDSKFWSIGAHGGGKRKLRKEEGRGRGRGGGGDNKGKVGVTNDDDLHDTI